MKRRTSRTTLYGAFEKVEKQDDGTLIVTGYASSEARDADGEVIKADAMANAIPDYMRWGAVREMHQASAAGTAMEMQVEGDGRTAFKAHVVDPVAVLKVETEVYKGFSIGGRVVKRDPADRSVITELQLTEVSLVDRPANPEAVMKFAKIDGADDGAEPIQKGLWSVARLASLLQDVQWLASDEAWDAEIEGDGSPIPAQLGDWLSQGVTILSAMVTEEGAEAVADLPGGDVETVEVVELSAPAGDVEKAATPEEPSTPAEPVTPPTPVGDDERIAAIVAKALGAARETDLQKAIDAAVEKATGALRTELADTRAALDALKAHPAAPKGAVLAVPVPKVVDSVNPKTDPELTPGVDPVHAAKAKDAFAMVPGLSVRKS